MNLPPFQCEKSVFLANLNLFQGSQKSFRCLLPKLRKKTSTLLCSLLETDNFSGLSCFFFKRIDSLLQMLEKSGEIFPNRFPDDVMIYVEIGMNEPVS